MNNETNAPAELQAPVPYTIRYFIIDRNRWLAVVDIHSEPDVHLFDCREPQNIEVIEHWTKVPPHCDMTKVRKSCVPAVIRARLRYLVTSTLLSLCVTAIASNAFTTQL